MRYLQYMTNKQKKIRRLSDTRGLTIIEVLIAATVFMIGFSIMVFLLTEINRDYSAKDITIAYHLGTAYLERALAEQDFSSRVDTLEVSSITFRIEKHVEKEDRLNKIRIDVYRAKQNKLLLSLYNEKYIETF